ncbi:MAG: FAD-dependent oxidoreductase [Elusimicrobia bacterium]|nr:FAD-dependent oxidoreductase [Elusimicrobiota bacterium]
MGEDQLLTRRQFLGLASAVGGGALLGSCRPDSPREAITGAIMGQSHRLGHRLVQGGFPPPKRTIETGVVIVGGGIAGLSAGWKLDRSGFKDFLILELESRFGGNSRWGQNEFTRYPWAAHYIPFPTAESAAVSELLGDLGVETGRGPDGKPRYDERFVCFAPQERLFIHGRWQEGIFPRLGATADDIGQLKAFDKAMAGYRRMKDARGRRAFALPMHLSSRRDDLLALDRLSMADWLKAQGLTSPRLRWYVDYACRDDFGTIVEETSAWAGIHYYASRGEGADDQVLTWPEGNGYVVDRLAGRLKTRLRADALVFDVEETSSGVQADCWDPAAGESVRVRAKAAIVCVPMVVARRVVARLRREDPPWIKAFSYAPWLVANLTVEDPPEGKGFPTAWDNVIYDSEGLGYVVATHQGLERWRRETVWTYYHPLAKGDASQLRKAALERPWGEWRDIVLKDLSRAHPGVARHVRRLDVMVLGHAMVKPAVGFMWGPERLASLKPLGRVFLAHSDLSGFSLFEEAQYHGVLAAQRALSALGRSFTPSV